MFTKNDLFDFDFSNQGHVLAFLSRFNSVLANSALISADVHAELTFYNNGAGHVTIQDRDYWLNRKLLEYNGPQHRLAWDNGLPSSDPLGLAVGHSGQVIFIDGQNPIGVFVGIDAANVGNLCWTDEARTVAASPTALWDDASDIVYNHTVWRDLFSLDETGTNPTRRYPRTTDPVTVYVRGGEYDLYRELRFNHTTSGQPDCARIVVRPYPGETVTARCGNSKSGGTWANTSIVTTQRPDVSWWVGGVGNRRVRASDGLTDGLIYAPRLFGTSTSGVLRGDRFKLLACRWTGWRSIPPDHADAASLPHLVDQAWHDRTSDDSGTVFGLTATATDCEVRCCHLEPAGEDYPANETDTGETIDLSGAGGVISRNRFRGCGPHFQIRVRVGGSATITHNDIENHEHGGVLLNDVADCTVNYNRITNIGITDLGGDGAGIQGAGCDSCTLEENVIWFDSELPVTDGTRAGLFLTKDGGGNASTNNIVRKNVFYRCTVFQGHVGGSPVGSGITGNTFEQNVMLDQAVLNRDLGDDSDAPLILNLGVHSADSYTNEYTGNLIRRLDATTVMLTERLPAPQSQSRYDVDGVYVEGVDPGTTFSTLWTDNFDADPLFANPEYGDFTLLAGSPIATWFSADAPLAEQAACIDIVRRQAVQPTRGGNAIPRQQVAQSQAASPAAEKPEHTAPKRRSRGNAVKSAMQHTIGSAVQNTISSANKKAIW